MTPQEDYQNFLSEVGATESFIRAKVQDPTDQITIDPGPVIVGISDIEGLGLFSKKEYAPGIPITQIRPMPLWKLMGMMWSWWQSL